jgi:drug/metabolite transporter (DMT)-like permease
MRRQVVANDSRSLAVMFVLTGANVLALGYTLIDRYPVAVTVTCTLALVLLVLWYVTVRGADDRVRQRTVRSLVGAIGVGTLAVVVLRRILGSI